MYRFVCKCCHSETYIPDVTRCPFCNKDLHEATPEYVKKHIRSCGCKVNPYRYSDRRAGRPTNKERERLLETDI